MFQHLSHNHREDTLGKNIDVFYTFEYQYIRLKHQCLEITFIEKLITISSSRYCSVVIFGGGCSRWRSNVAFPRELGAGVGEPGPLGAISGLLTQMSTFRVVGHPHPARGAHQAAEVNFQL